MPTAVPPTPDPDGRAITAIWAQPFAEVPLEIEWCKTPKTCARAGLIISTSSDFMHFIRIAWPETFHG
jgi:hypothetical protein